MKFAGIVARPESRYTPEGKQILTFSVGLYTGGNKEAGYKDRQWIRVEALEALAEQWASLQKGQTVTVSGRPKPPRTWTDKEGKERDAGFEVVAREIVNGDFERVELPADEYPF